VNQRLGVGMAIQTWAGVQLARLKARYPDWDIWHVPVFMGPDIWCARVKGEPVARFKAASPDELEFMIQEEP
jgi:hypothetical protein